MSGKVKAIPDGYHTITPNLIIRGAADAIEFYKKALGATELMRMPGPGGKIMHAEMRIGNSRIMITDEMPEMGTKSPQALGGSPVGLFLYVDDVDAFFKRAASAGCKTTLPPTDMFWGDRFCKFVDPYGHDWGAATHKEDVAPEEMGKRAAAAMAGK